MPLSYITRNQYNKNMDDKFYPITIENENNLFIAKITELGISSQGPDYQTAYNNCIKEKEKIIKKLKKKKIPLPPIINDDKIDIFKFRNLKIFSWFTIKSIFSTLISIATILLLLIMLSPLFKTYIEGPYSKIHLKKFSDKLGISFDLNKN